MTARRTATRKKATRKKARRKSGAAFRIDIGEGLSAGQRKRVEGAIRKSVMGELGKMDLGGRSFRPPRGIHGMRIPELERRIRKKTVRKKKKTARRKKPVARRRR